MSTDALPPVAPEVLAEAVEQLSARLRKKLDAAIESCTANIAAAADGSVDVPFGEDAVVSLRPGPSGAIVDAGQAVCTCLLAPRCLHRAAVLGAAPIAEMGAPGELGASDELNGSSGTDRSSGASGASGTDGSEGSGGRRLESGGDPSARGGC
ncbi:SWIM zinc finger family protein, partial [Streptomyces sp. SR27]|nr:SWIM zinc finger family protein [Streptomyces sp. SR27]